MRFLRWLVHGSDELYLPESWLADRERLAAYEVWTERERWSAVISTPLEMKRRELWQRALQPEPERPAHVAQFIRRRQ